MISDPNYQLPKDGFIRLFDNPIPAGDPARSDAPEWAQELDEVVVWAHMGDNGEVTVFVNGEEAGGGEISYAEVSFTPATVTGVNVETYIPSTFQDTIICKHFVCGASGGGDPTEINVVVPAAIYVPSDLTISSNSTGAYTFDSDDNKLAITGQANIIFEVI